MAADRSIDSPDLQADIAEFLDAFGLDSQDLYDAIPTRTFQEDRPQRGRENEAVPERLEARGGDRESPQVAILGGTALTEAALIAVALAIGTDSLGAYAAILSGLVPAVAAMSLLLLSTARRRAQVHPRMRLAPLSVAVGLLLTMATASAVAGIASLAQDGGDLWAGVVAAGGVFSLVAAVAVLRVNRAREKR
jgi:hypothetical protein